MEGRVNPAAMRPPVVFGWNIKDLGSIELLRVIKLTERLGIALVSLDLNATAEEHIFSPRCGSDLVLTYNYWSQRIVAKIDNIDEAFKPYMDWTAYVGLRAVCITCEYAFKEAQGVHELHELLANLSQKLKSFLNSPNVPTVVLSFLANDASWEYWKAIHEMTNYSTQLKVAIMIDEHNHQSLDRWVAEPLAAIIIDESAFVKEKGSVHVDKAIAPHLKFFLKYNIKITLTGDYDFKLIREASMMRSCESLEMININSLEVPQMEDGIGVREAMAAIRALHASLPSLTEAELFREQHLDLLQEPLQPVRDNLDTVTYEHFEKCPVKYANYGAAVDQWIKDFMSGTIVKSSNDENDKKGPVIFVVGAGRGPLVDCVLKALINNGVKNSSVYAVEKNPATLYTLKHKVAKNEIEGWKDVKLIFHDMREFKPPEPADLVLSELLGSFGDNELAPECIDGMQIAMEKTYPGHHVTFIPQSITSYVEPLYAPKLWSTVSYVEAKSPYQHAYNVAMQRIYKLSDGPQPCFKFEHPCNKLSHKEVELVNDFNSIPQLSNAHNDRYISMAFKSKSDCQIHGFAGYFECTLYKEVKLSIVPGVMEDQISWFPIFFPLLAPVPVKKFEHIVIHVWRKHDSRRMWYEWALTLPHVTAVHNSNGTGHSILR